MIPRGEALHDALLAVPPADRDAWVDQLLGLGEAPPDSGLPPGGVPYLPAGVAEILAMIREVPVKHDDTFVDLGSGLGRVVMLTHLLTGAKAQGIEIQRELVERAKACAARLRLSGVSFLQADAATAELDGSVFFLYAPFNGELLKRVLARLEEVARRRPIRVCTVDLALDGVRWLRPRPTDSLALTIYEGPLT
jgi:SAM-dependent methyltransferase